MTRLPQGDLIMSDKDNDKIKNPIAVAARERVNTKTESAEPDPGCCTSPPNTDPPPPRG
jgi:hypothetical protein